MPEVNEKDVFDALLRYRVSGSIPCTEGKIEVELRAVDNHVGDSPDFLLWVEIRFDLFGQRVKIAVPVLVEAEKGGIYSGALRRPRQVR